MSELFDSLRRARQSAVVPSRSAARLNRGEALLASLGYKPIRRTNPAAVSAIALVALAGAAYYSWIAWPTPASAPRGQSAAVARPVPVGPRAAIPEKREEPAPAPAPAASRGATPTARKTVLTPVPAPKEEMPVATTEKTTRERTPVGVVPPPAPPSPRVETRAPRVGTRPGPHTVPSAAVTETESFNLGVYHQRSGDFENALLNYRAVLEKNELNAQARNNLGLLYLEKGLFDDAVRELRRALIIDPRYPRARINLGVTLMRANKLDEAAAEFKAILAQDPRHVDALVNLALVEKATGRVEHAKELLIRAVGFSPRSAWAHYNLAVVFDHSGEVARAVEHYRSFLDNAGPDISARAPDVRARLDALTRR